MAWCSWEMQGSKPGKCSRRDGGNQWVGDLNLMHGHWEMQQNCCASPKYRFQSVQTLRTTLVHIFAWLVLLVSCSLPIPPLFHVQNVDQAGCGQGCASSCSRGSPMAGSVPATHCSGLYLGACCSNRYRVNLSCADAFPQQRGVLAFPR